jgi:hypothetical protein
MFRIEQVANFGVMTVYRRTWNEPGLRRYFVLRESDGHILEEFTTKLRAYRWARTNQNG